MFRRKVLTLDNVVSLMLRAEGLETPLRQRRLIEAWDEVAGPIAARYTQEKSIRNQTLLVRMRNPALRQDLSMRKTELVRKLNDKVGGMVIADIHFYG